VTNLGVAHVIIGGQADSHTVRLERYHGVLAHQSVKSGRIRACNGVGDGIGCKTNTVHNDGQNGTLHALKVSKLLQLIHKNLQKSNNIISILIIILFFARNCKMQTKKIESLSKIRKKVAKPLAFVVNVRYNN
jgi:hypothetical protein